MNKNYSPCAKTVAAWCVGCDRQFELKVCQRNRAINPCCGSWSRRPRAAVNKLVEDHLRLAYHAAARTGVHRFIIERNGTEDWNNQAVIYLIHAAHRWDEDYRTPEGEPVRFTTFASTTIKNNLRMWCSREMMTGYSGIPIMNDRGFATEFVPHARIGFSMDPMSNQLDVVDVAAPEQIDVLEDSDDIDRIKAALRELQPRTAQAIWLRHAGHTYDEIGKKLNISKERVRQIIEVGMLDLKLLLGVAPGKQCAYVSKKVKRGRVNA